MEWFHAVVLGLIQGLTEFLPVSSSGHLAIFKAIFGIDADNLTFEVAVHAATVLSTIVAFRKEIWDIVKGVFKFRYNAQTQYFLKICVSMIPVFIVGVFFKDTVTDIFGSGLVIVGSMLLLTALLLFIGESLSNRQMRKDAVAGKPQGKEVGYKEAFIVGIAQAFAVLPGLSRSGSTISTGLMLGVKKSAIAQFSFLMVLIPILGETFLEIVGGGMHSSGIPALSLVLGTLTAFVSGYAACRWMIRIVQKARLRYFSIYCCAAAIFCFIFEIVNKAA